MAVTSRDVDIENIGGKESLDEPINTETNSNKKHWKIKDILDIEQSKGLYIPSLESFEEEGRIGDSQLMIG
jgi:hypothetical protein